jgi:hypothetical protein
MDWTPLPWVRRPSYDTIFKNGLQPGKRIKNDNGLRPAVSIWKWLLSGENYLYQETTVLDMKNETAEKMTTKRKKQSCEPISKRSELMLKNRSGPELNSNKRQIVAQKLTEERKLSKNH